MCLLSLLKFVASTDLYVSLRFLSHATFGLCPDLCNFLEITSLTSREEDRKDKDKTVSV